MLNKPQENYPQIRQMNCSNGGSTIYPQITQMSADSLLRDEQTYAIIGAEMAVHQVIRRLHR